MTGPSAATLVDAVERLSFGVGVWIRGEPHLTAQLDWDRRPAEPRTWRAVEQLLEVHRRVIAGDGGAPAQEDLRRLSCALDPNAVRGPSASELLQSYRKQLVDLAMADA